MNANLSNEPTAESYSNTHRSDLFDKIVAFLRLPDSRLRESSSLKEIASDFMVSSLKCQDSKFMNSSLLRNSSFIS